MQQFQSTTAEQSAETTLSACVSSDEVVMLPPQSAESSRLEQEQSEAVGNLLTALERDTRRRQKWNVVISRMFAVGVCFYLAVGAVAALLHKQVDIGNIAVWIWLFQAIGTGLGLLFLNKSAAAELTRVEDTRCVGALVDIWKKQESVNYSQRTRRRAAHALTRLLPRLKASDAPLLKEAQRMALRNVLASGGYIGFGKYHDAALMVSILQAFEQIGDWKSLAYVQKLAQECKMPTVRAAAKECLPYLEALEEKQKPGENLLRASSANEAASLAPRTLLRPVVIREETQLDTLLWPAGE